VSTTIPASLVKDLRDQTGAGMMECKRALVEADGDLEQARRILRERGLAAAGKRAGRETSEGRVLTHVIERGGVDAGAIVAVGCETEPVSSNEEFREFAQRVLEAVMAEGPDAVEAMDEERVELIARLGENIEIVGAARLEAEAGDVIASYVHPPANKIGVMLRAGNASPELARLVAMHISFANPRYVSREEVPEEAVEEERTIFEKLPEVAGKPEDVRPKIVEGMLAKRFFAEIVLEDQAWIHDPDRTVGKALAEHGAEVREFVRYAVAESQG
jgi:elongation factor Ts